ncbi:MAG: hypothetical protein HY696_10405 [Deltaproteobacteria bacterium]|nr:hypothetical protein [Deltaproteobacteria bacterium]
MQLNRALAIITGVTVSALLSLSTVNATPKDSQLPKTGLSDTLDDALDLEPVAAPQPARRPTATRPATPTTKQPTTAAPKATKPSGVTDQFPDWSKQPKTPKVEDDEFDNEY